MFFCLLGIFDGFVVACASCFDHIIMVFGVGFEGDFCIAIGAFEIEPEDFDAEIGLLVTDFHSHVELGADVEIVGTCVAAQTHG